MSTPEAPISPSADELFRLIEDRTQMPEVRSSAMWKLSRRRGGDALELLLRVFHDATEDSEVRSAAAFQVAYTGPARRTRGPLLRAARNEPNPVVRRATVEAAAHLGTKHVVPTMLAILEDRTELPEIRSEAAHTIGMNVYHTPTALTGRLIPFLRDPSPAVRLTTAYALMQCGKSRAINALKLLVNDYTEVPRWWTIAREARWAINALRNSGRSGSRDYGWPTDLLYGTYDWELKPIPRPRRRKR